MIAITDRDKKIIDIGPGFKLAKRYESMPDLASAIRRVYFRRRHSITLGGIIIRNTLGYGPQKDSLSKHKRRRIAKAAANAQARFVASQRPSW